MTDFQNQVAIVTGTTGIGRASAKRLARGGAQVLACGIDTAGNDSLKREAEADKLTLTVRKCDIASPNDIESTVKAAVQLFGGVDVLVNAAAINPYGTVTETDLATWNQCFAVNVTSIFLFARYCVPEMKKRGEGAIVNIASVQGHACQRGVVAYATSKGAVLALTRALALDHAADGIRVNSISPGSIRTPMLELAARTFSPELPVEQVFRRFGEAHPIGRIVTPEEVAELIAFLSSRTASFCTGADYLVDGGLLAAIAVR